MILTLTVTEGRDSGKSFRFIEGDAKVAGRSSRCNIVLRDVGASRQHCRIHVKSGACCVSDLNSKNGTSVNDRRILGEATLKDGDLLEIGGSKLAVRISAGSAPPAPEEAESAEPAPFIEAPPIEINVESSPEAPSEPDQSGESLMGAFDQWLDEPAPQSADEAASEKPAPVAIDPGPRDEPEAPPDPAIGTVIGGCRVEELIGDDDISRIYRAMQVSMERIVALKILLPHMTHDSNAVDRFIQGARAGGKLIHPNIVHVYDAGEDDKVYFIALELVDGKSARQLLHERGRNRPLDLLQAIEIAEQIAGAIDYAHEQAIIHRNITSDNVLVTAHGIAKLADLGFAKNLADAGIERPTRPGERIGELQFTAPEQLIDARAAGPAADLYSLGAVLFNMLTGHLPFIGKSELDIMQNVRDGHHQSLCQLRHEAPDALAKIVDRAMARDPAGRHGRASELQDELRQVREQLRS